MTTPTWGQQPQPAPAPRRTGGCLKYGCLTVLAAVGFVTIVVVTKDLASTHTAAATTTTLATGSATPSGSALSLPAGGNKGPAKLAPAANRQKAAGILRADDAHYQAEYQHGVTVVLDRGQPGSYGPFSTWYEMAVRGDVQPGLDAFKQADAQFTADDEPSSISDWQGDNGQLSSDLVTLANDGTGVGGPDDATSRAKVLADEKQFATDFATAEKDADNVAAGK
jgi:hypothetical protein